MGLRNQKHLGIAFYSFEDAVREKFFSLIDAEAPMREKKFPEDTIRPQSGD